MSDDLNWPREIWMAEREEHDQGVVTAVLSEWGTVHRWEGDKERDREFHRYVDADIHESADKYWRARIADLEAQLAEARADRDAAIAAALEEAADAVHEECWTDGVLTGGTPELLAEQATTRLAIDAIRALIPQSGADALERARAVKVKPLVWEEYSASNGKRQIAYAVTPLVTYRITQKFFPETFFSIEVVDGAFLSAETLEAAKAAAQADYEKRICYALVHVTPDMLAQARADGMREAAGIAHKAWRYGGSPKPAILAAIEKGEG